MYELFIGCKDSRSPFLRYSKLSASGGLSRWSSSVTAGVMRRRLDRPITVARMTSDFDGIGSSMKEVGWQKQER